MTEPDGYYAAREMWTGVEPRKPLTRGTTVPAMVYRALIWIALVCGAVVGVTMIWLALQVPEVPQ